MAEKSIEDPQRGKRGAAASAAVAANLGESATELGRAKGGALTLPEKAVFRQSELSAAALEAAAGKVALAIGTAVGWTGTVLVTDRTDLVGSVLTGQAFRNGVAALTEEARAVLAGRRGLTSQKVAEEPTGDGDEPALATAPGTVLGALTALAVAGLDLLGVDTAVDSSTHTADALETHIAVMQRLLPTVGVRHDSIGLQRDENEVLTEFSALLPLAARLDAKAAESADAVERLGAKPKAVEVAELTALKTRAEKLSEAIRAFAATATAIGADGGSPLLAAARAHELAAGDSPVGHLAVVLPARIDAHQVSLKRRVLASKLVVTASATIDVLVLDPSDGRIVVAGSHTASRSFQIRFPMWWWPFGRTARERPDQLGIPVYTPLAAWPLTQPGSDEWQGPPPLPEPGPEPAGESHP